MQCDREKLSNVRLGLFEDQHAAYGLAVRDIIRKHLGDLELGPLAYIMALGKEVHEVGTDGEEEKFLLLMAAYGVATAMIENSRRCDLEKELADE